MDLRQLEILRAIVETGSFTGAGRKLHVSQSAISRQILLLEDELNEPVFLRLGRSLKITPAGDALLALSQRVFEDLRETRIRIADKQQTLTGSINIAGGMTVCLYVFPELLKEFRDLHPAVDVRVTSGSASQLVNQLRSGGVDLALLTLPVPEAELVTLPVIQEELLLVCDPQHPLAGRNPVRPEDLVGQPFVLFEAMSATRQIIEEFFVRENVQPRIVMETENVEIIKSLVKIGLGIAIVPYLAVDRELRANELSCARIAEYALIRQTGWVHPRLNRVPRAVQEMMKALDRVIPGLRLSPEPTVLPPTDASVEPAKPGRVSRLGHGAPAKRRSRLRRLG